MLQITWAKCLIFRSATRWLYSFPWDWAEPGSPSGAAPLEQPWASWKLSLDSPSPLSAPELLRSPRPPWVHNLSTVGSYCPRIPLKALDCQVSSSRLKFLIRLCLFIILNTCWRFLAPELSGQELFFMFLHNKAVQYPSWAAERILFSTLSELLLSLVSFFLTMILENIILGYFRFLVSFFPSRNKTVEIITKLSWDKKITDTERGLRKREEERIALIKPHIR